MRQVETLLRDAGDKQQVRFETFSTASEDRYRRLELEVKDNGSSLIGMRTSVEFLNKQIADMVVRITDLRAEMRQAFIDADFSRNAEAQPTRGRK